MACGCKKNGKGHNFMPERITLAGEGGKEITNRDLACHHCVYKKRGDTLSCLKYEQKPEGVLKGEPCESFLSTGHDLGKNSGAHSCGDCGGDCGGSCTDCGGCAGHEHGEGGCEHGCGGC